MFQITDRKEVTRFTNNDGFNTYRVLHTDFSGDQ